MLIRNCSVKVLWNVSPPLFSPHTHEELTVHERDSALRKEVLKSGTGGAGWGTTEPPLTSSPRK